MMREAFVSAASELLDTDPQAAVVLAEISADCFAEAAARHPDRVLNVGIREQLMIGVGGGLALAGLAPIMHSYAPFLVSRAFEQVKLDLGHQGVGAVLVSVGASYDWPGGGKTHHAPEDVALLDTLPGMDVHVPGHPDEVPGLLAGAVSQLHQGGHSSYIRLSVATNERLHGEAERRLRVIKTGSRAVVIVVGPMLDPVLAAVADLDVTVAYATTVRPFDADGLRALGGDSVIMVEPYLAGTSARVVSEALAGRPHRLLGLGVQRAEVRRYGTPEDHARLHGLDPAGLRGAISSFLGLG
jgi:transketolase